MEEGCFFLPSTRFPSPNPISPQKDTEEDSTHAESSRCQDTWRTFLSLGLKCLKSIVPGPSHLKSCLSSLVRSEAVYSAVLLCQLETINHILACKDIRMHWDSGCWCVSIRADGLCKPSFSACAPGCWPSFLATPLWLGQALKPCRS